MIDRVLNTRMYNKINRKYERCNKLVSETLSSAREKQSSYGVSQKGCPEIISE